MLGGIHCTMVVLFLVSEEFERINRHTTTTRIVPHEPSFLCVCVCVRARTISSDFREAEKSISHVIYRLRLTHHGRIRTRIHSLKVRECVALLGKRRRHTRTQLPYTHAPYEQKHEGGEFPVLKESSCSRLMRFPAHSALPHVLKSSSCTRTLPLTSSLTSSALRLVRKSSKTERERTYSKSSKRE